MTDGAGAASATFDGGGWALRNGATYYAYYPYNWEYCESEDFKNKIPYTYIGQKAVYEDENGVVNLGAYDYMYTSASTPASGSVNFAFHHVGALARMEITFLATATYTKLIIAASKAIFPVTGTFDLTAETFALKSSELASSIEIDLENLAGTQDEKKLVYFMLPPADCGDLESFTAKIIDDEATEYTGEIEKKNIEPGRAYGWSISLEKVEQEPGTLVNGVAKLAEAGTLATVLGDQMLTLTSLKVIGEINGTDVKCLRQMLGGKEFNESGKLAVLDLTDASIVEGGDYYYQDKYSVSYNTGNNEVGHYMFYDCGGLQLVQLPHNITDIGDSAFRNCSSLVSVNIPDGVTAIGAYTFYGCSSLASVNIPDSVADIGAYTFYGCSSLASVNIPDGVTAIGDNTFYGCSSLASVNIPDSVADIGISVFYNCSSLSCVNIPNSVTTIGSCTFDGCSSLASVNIPEGVTTIGLSAFKYCSKLQEVTCLATVPPTLEVLLLVLA